ncbi:Inositol-3-phosphate synthase [Planctomycetes bacterium Pan216]|uniref:Inositol-3-phosphate synthase n=1 Tax=Kolteria novifilia TaxID=2527975 RepID=A0A518B9Y7_9BACT|nr:Inositol-3-phosphate synthase [Planctomycetes bacterium Pan216]
MTGQPTRKVGLWLIGAFGGVGTTISFGIASLARGLTNSTSLATELPNFADLGFLPFDRIVVGGHDVRRSSLFTEAQALHKNSNVYDAEAIAACEPELKAWSENVRPGLLSGSGAPVAQFADWTTSQTASTPLDIVTRLADDLRAFASRQKIDHLIVLNVSSSEPMPTVGPEHDTWAKLVASLSSPNPPVIPASSLYGLAAAEVGASYVNFTPSLGLDTPALTERAREAGMIYAGKDGKTGETLMKAVLAPMFAHRHWKVMSWVGHNILGNRDGKVLQDPASKAGKLTSKSELIGGILGYEPQTLVSIEHIESMGDWKTAWDHIHFEGFLGTKMSLQFIWQGCDSLLAAPLAIDLVRWTELAYRRGERGCLTHLACYFKSPLNTKEQDFFRQWDMLEAYAARSV